MAMLSIERVINRLESFITHLGKAISWLTLLMMLTMTAVVCLRYGFNIGWIWLQEIVNYLHAFIFMIAISYTLQQNEHVRVDIFYSKMTKHNQNKVNFAGHLLFLLPTCTFIIIMSWHYVLQSWHIAERSQEAGGLPLVFILKSLLLLMPSLLLIQALCEMVKIGLTEKHKLSAEQHKSPLVKQERGQ